MRATGAAFRFQKLGWCLRKSPRTKAFMAGLLARDEHSEPLGCLIRDISPTGAQIRASAAQPVPEQDYMIHLDARSAYRIHTVWRQGSLAGLRLGTAVAIDDFLPADLEFLSSLFRQAKLRQADQMFREGVARLAALRKCGIAEYRDCSSGDNFPV